LQEWFLYLLHLKKSKAEREMTYLIITATVYQIWSARNLCIYKGKTPNGKGAVQEVQEQGLQSTLFQLKSLKNIEGL